MRKTYLSWLVKCWHEYFKSDAEQSLKREAVRKKDQADRLESEKKTSLLKMIEIGEDLKLKKKSILFSFGLHQGQNKSRIENAIGLDASLRWHDSPAPRRPLRS